MSIKAGQGRKLAAHARGRIQPMQGLESRGRRCLQPKQIQATPIHLYSYSYICIVYTTYTRNMGYTMLHLFTYVQVYDTRQRSNSEAVKTSHRAMEMDMRQRIDRRRREQFAKFTRALGEAEALSNLKHQQTYCILL